MSKSLELVWSEQEPVRVFSTAHFLSAASQSGSNRIIQVGDADRAIFPARAYPHDSTRAISANAGTPAT